MKLSSRLATRNSPFSARPMWAGSNRSKAENNSTELGWKACTGSQTQKRFSLHVVLTAIFSLYGLFWINFCFYLTKQNIYIQEKQEWSNPILPHDFLQLCIHPVQQQQQQNQCFQESYTSSYTPTMICNLNNTAECNLFKKCNGKNKSELTQVHTNFKLYPKHTQPQPSPSYSTNPHELQKSRLSSPATTCTDLSLLYAHAHTSHISVAYIIITTH